ncbi:MAG: hypothetical protein K6C40_04960 [Thermoguttaceae bacterium]|nr:hypothetical protein [Thermoguttaceae bacterium]
MTTPERIPAESELPLIIYRLSTYMLALFISLFLLSILPAISFLGYVWEWSLFIFLYACIVVGVLSGIIAILSLLERELLESFTFLIFAGGGYWLHGYVLPFYEYSITCSPWFYETVWEVYYSYSVGFYAWIPFAIVVGCGCFAWPLLFTAKFLNYLPRIIYGKVHCPHPDCDYVGGITIQCPDCGTMIPNLAPSRYGVFVIPCPNCKKKLATGWLWGKNNYSRHCLQCFEDWNILGLGSSLTRRVILMGASQSGKTSYLVKSIAEMNRFYPNHILYTTFQQESTIQNLACNLSPRNSFETNNQIKRPKAVPILFQTSPRKILTYFYDSLGNEFRTESLHHLLYNRVDGIFLLMDPFAEPGILEYMKIKPNELPFDIEIAKQRADVIAGELCVILERMTGKGSASRFHVPLCVVLTKTDMFNLYKHIDPEIFSMTNWEDHSRKTQEFLRNCGLDNFLAILESRFSHTMFFASSAFLNYHPQDLMYNSTLPPMLWMMRQIRAF